MATKTQAESIARSIAAGQVVPMRSRFCRRERSEKQKDVDSDLDKAIDKNLDAAFIQIRMKDGIKHSVKNGVVRWTVMSAVRGSRAQAQGVAAGVPNVRR